MSPHRALESLDILEEIFQYYSPANMWEIENRRDLARAARVCRAFADPALNVLWRSLEDMLPALMLFPSFSISMVADGNGKDKREISLGEISQAAWERFLQYAKRVRELSLTTTGILSSAPSCVLEQLAQHNNGQALFPCLEELLWIQPLRSSTGILHLIAPSLQILSIRNEVPTLLIPTIGGEEKDKLGKDEQVFEDVLKSIFSRVSYLQTLALTGTFHPLLLVPIGMCKSLREVSISRVSRDVNLQGIKALASLPHLVKLLISPPLTIGEITDCKGFPVLEVLNIRSGSSSTAVTRFLSMILSPSLHELIASITADVDAQIRPVLSLIASKFPSLRELQFGVIHPGVERISFSGAFKPVMSLRSLRIANFGVSSSMSLSAEQLVDAASAWPDVEELSISSTMLLQGDDPSIDAVHVLTEISRLCLKLESLNIPYLDYQNPPSVNAHIAGPGHGLRDLEMSDYSNRTITDHARVAHFLDSVFPQLAIDSALRMLKWPRQNATGTGANWERVLELMKELRRERELTGEN
ncbi:hypothetical protein SCP_1401360 [Sparassis crispa]|uniref:F-box domain-containing protein n=1 Tax=Sparassis crispa TaxID=139825 RepID=A0A401H2U1_9APHY|nr:hypothetical protein SCP_1401360 [Sparassis crispa]GBE88731.1 hypothetical protein SCP_1401360 [Sparassis crispa]